MLRKIHPFWTLHREGTFEATLLRRNGSCGKRVEGLQMNVIPIVAHLQSTVVTEPRKRPLDNISESSKPASVLRMPCSWGDQRDDSASLHLVDDIGRPVSHIRL